jgi:hypothetical protein
MPYYQEFDLSVTVAGRVQYGWSFDGEGQD